MLAYFLLSPKATTRMLYLALSSITIGLFFLWKAFHFRREEEDFSQSQSGVKSPLPTPRIPSPKQVVSKASTPIPPRKQSFFTKTELEMSGTLYLDQKQSTRRLYKEQGKSLSPKAYSAIHHVGRGRTKYKGEYDFSTKWEYKLPLPSCGFRPDYLSERGHSPPTPFLQTACCYLFE